MTDAITTRTDLIDQLAAACELEQGLCLQYLFTAFSLKDSADEDLAPDELIAVRKWKSTIFLIGAQEMLHLAQAANLLTAIGGAVQLRRPNFPQSRNYYPTGLPWGLFPWSRETIRLYACYERPTVIPPADLELIKHGEFTEADEAALYHERADRWRSKQPFDHLPGTYAGQQPQAVEHTTIGGLYAAIRRAYGELHPTSGELLIGRRAAQIDGRLIDFHQLVEVDSRARGEQAIDLIVRQGEGSAGDRGDDHYGMFTAILREHDRLLAKNPAFEPGRDVHPNPLSRLHVDTNFPGWRLIHDDYTRAVNDLASGVYVTMMLMLYRFFADIDGAQPQQRALAWSFLRIMTGVIKPLGEALTRLPMGDDGTRGAERRPQFAGMSFEIGRFTQLLPNPDSAWLCVDERLREHAAAAAALARDPRAGLADHVVAVPYLENTARTLAAITDSFAGAKPRSTA